MGRSHHNRKRLCLSRLSNILQTRWGPQPWSIVVMSSDLRRPGPARYPVGIVTPPSPSEPVSGWLLRPKISTEYHSMAPGRVLLRITMVMKQATITWAAGKHA